MPGSDPDILIVDAVRSILGSDNGSLRDLDLGGLGSAVLAGLLERLGARGLREEEVPNCFVLGICSGAGGGQNVPRQVWDACGLPPPETAYAVNMLCGSSFEAMLRGLISLRAGEYEAVICGGLESPARSPWLVGREEMVAWRDRRLEDVQVDVSTSAIHDALWCIDHDCHAIVHAEATTATWARDRGRDPDALKEEIDSWACESNDRALRAWETGAFAEEVITIPGASDRDELPKRRKPSLLARRQGTQYTPDGLYLTNMNSPQPATGAAFMLLATPQWCERTGVPPRARILGYGRSATREEDFLLAPVTATRNLFAATGTTVAEFDLVEANTSFGSQMLINRDELGFDMDRTNVHGDAVALGHPFGAAGIRLTTTLMSALERTGGRRGMTSICLGGGNGVALGIELT